MLAVRRSADVTKSVAGLSISSRLCLEGIAWQDFWEDDRFVTQVPATVNLPQYSGLVGWRGLNDVESSSDRGWI